MSAGTGVEALLEEARLAKVFTSPEERQRLREAAGLSRAQVAAAVGVGRNTVGNWETGVSDPTPPARLEYLRLLKGLAELFPPAATSDGIIASAGPASPAAPEASATPVAEAVPPTFTANPSQTLRGPDEGADEGDPGPCV
ncbi:helix-turn-helix domain-containing protein [Streptomyces microflavus]|uniref:helix-turn-helix domain-containing protein n=1 Tax=Streptomyces microflavus TaxID=1919 RepID=UPI0036880A5A